MFGQANLYDYATGRQRVDHGSTTGQQRVKTRCNTPPQFEDLRCEELEEVVEVVVDVDVVVVVGTAWTRCRRRSINCEPPKALVKISAIWLAARLLL